MAATEIAGGGGWMGGGRWEDVRSVVNRGLLRHSTAEFFDARDTLVEMRLRAMRATSFVQVKL